MSSATECRLDTELRVSGVSLSYSDLRLIADGKHAEVLPRAWRRVQRRRYVHNLMLGLQAVLILYYWLSQHSPWPPAIKALFVVWAVGVATLFAADLWSWPIRRRAFASALARLERDVAERSQDGEASG
jgi:hypothetical protein